MGRRRVPVREEACIMQPIHLVAAISGVDFWCRAHPCRFKGALAFCLSHLCTCVASSVHFWAVASGVYPAARCSRASGCLLMLLQC